MTPSLVGAFLGLAAAAGVLIAVLALPPLRRPTLEDRIAPYLRDTAQASRLLTPSSVPFSGLILRPLLVRTAGWVDRLVGGRRSVRRRLQALDSEQSVEDFRLEQVLWGQPAC